MTTPTLPTVWSADWITASVDPHAPTAAPLFRREWHVDAPIVTAVVHLSGLATAVATINAQPIDDTHLGPGQSDYSVAARAVSVDVTSLVAGEQEVVVAVELGRGFFDLHTPEVWLWSTAPWRDSPRLTLQLHLTLDDGSEVVLTSDDTWRTSTGGTRFDSLYEGESFDQRLEPEGWRELGFDDHNWARATRCPRHQLAGRTHQRFSREVGTRGLPLRQAIADPIRVIDTLTPSWTRLDDDRWVGDLGAVIAGWVRLTPANVQAASEVASGVGSEVIEVSIVHGELLNDDGSVQAENRFIPTGRFQRDDVVLAGRAWQARHTWKGFRYLEVRGADPTSEVTVEALRAAADVAVTGSVSSDHPTLDWLDGAFRDTVLANLHWVPTDTPTYEKNGWTGDCLVALPAMLTRFDLSHYLASWLDDFLDAQRPSGELPVIIPSAGWGFAGSACSPAPEWTTLYPILVDAVVGEYGLDLWPIHREAVLAYLDYELSRLDDDALAVGILGDYLAPGFDGPPPEDVRFHSTIALIRALRITASALPESAAHLTLAADQLGLKLNELFFNAEVGVYSAVPLSGSRLGVIADPGFRQALQVQALDAGIVAEQHIDGVVAAVVADVTARGQHHNVGCLGGARLHSVLVRHGHAELAVAVAANPTAPSWETWRSDGHSTLLEMWLEPVRSRAHYFQGAGVRFLEDDLIGLSRSSGPAGWQRFHLEPHPVASVGRLELRRGDIVAGWSTGERAEFWVTVPPGSDTTVRLPGGVVHQLEQGQYRFDL